MHDFIVGDVTIELARMIEAALPGQILVGEFLADHTRDSKDHTQTQAHMDAVTFLQRAQGNLSKLSGMEFSGERVTAIKCYLTGENMGAGQFNIRRLTIKDKHGLSRVAYNAKVNIYRENTRPILLGIEDRKLPEARQPPKISGTVYLSIRCAANPGRANRCVNCRPKLVGARGFEPPTPTTPLWCATRLRYAPTELRDDYASDEIRRGERFRTSDPHNRHCGALPGCATPRPIIRTGEQ